MIDYFAIALTHGLILLAAWRLLTRDDLDHEGSPDQSSPKPWLQPDRSGDWGAQQNGGKPDA